MRIASLGLAVVLGLAACADTTATAPVAANPNVGVPATYQARVDTGPNGEPVEIKAVNVAYLTERNKRQQVPYNGSEAPGTIVVDPYARFLYHVLPGGQATRFGIAVGKAGTGFAGSGTIRRKASWPSWTPTANMVATNPELYGPVKTGLKGGIDNPLGSRALYLYQGGRDTLYRIHGTMDPSSIGKATSAGCIRLFNQDIMDLFNDVPIGTSVKVRTQAESVRLEGQLAENPEGYLQPVGAPAVPMSVAATPDATLTTAAATPVVVAPVESAVPR